MRRIAYILLSCSMAFAVSAQNPGAERWRAATNEELEAALPARAPVEKEHIETEMRTANGIIDSHNHVVAAVVLITAGYNADGKYSHFLLVQSPFTIDGHITLQPGSYVVGWQRAEDGLEVHFFDSATGAERGIGIARPEPGRTSVESFHIWPPGDHQGIQIGRFFLPYTVL
jgi:hypothetical protein